MKKIVLFFIVVFLSISISGCKKNKNNFKSVEEIKQNISTFDIVANFNGIRFELIKTSKGYYLADSDKNIYVFYDKTNHLSYRVDNTNQKKTLVVGNYDFSSYLDNIYYILTYHTSNSKISSLEKRANTYLNREVTEYYREKNEASETYYIDNQTGACLYFSIDTGEQKIVCKIDKLEIGDNFLDPYFAYENLQMADPNLFKSKKTVLEYFNNSYDLQIKFKDSDVHLIKSTDGFFCLLNENNTSKALLYNNNNHTWYDVDIKNQTRSITTVSDTVSEIENNFITLLVDHIDNVDITFYVKENQKFLDYTINMYERDITTDGILYTEEYYVEMETGICLRKKIDLSGSNNYFEVTSLEFSGDIQEYLDYEVVKKPQSYDHWPAEHKYLEGMEEIKYGEFYLAYEDNNELSIVYKNITNAAFHIILNNMKTYGFVIDSSEQKELDDNNTYLYYFYNAKREDDMKIRIEYVGTTLTIILGPDIAA